MIFAGAEFVRIIEFLQVCGFDANPRARAGNPSVPFGLSRADWVVAFVERCLALRQLLEELRFHSFQCTVSSLSPFPALFSLFE